MYCELILLCIIIYSINIIIQRYIEKCKSYIELAFIKKKDVSSIKLKLKIEKKTHKLFQKIKTLLM